MSVASTPSAVALRMIVPTFEGFITPSSTRARRAPGSTSAATGSGGLSKAPSISRMAPNPVSRWISSGSRTSVGTAGEGRGPE